MPMGNLQLPRTNYRLHLAVLLGLFGLLLPFSTGQGTSRQQYVDFHSQRNCSANSTMARVVSSTGILNSTLQNAYAISVNGLWKIDYNPNRTEIIFAEGACSSTNGTNGTYRQVTRYGNENQDLRALSLYADSNFGGMHIPIDTNGLDLSGSFSITSWHFTGNNSWNIYPGRNYTGTATCLRPDSQVVNRGYGITFTVSNRISVGSVRYTCSNSGTTTTTTTTTRSVTTSTRMTTTTRKSGSVNTFQKEMSALIMSLVLMVLYGV